MKCTQCGGNELKKTGFPYEIQGDAYCKHTADSYICLKCGHYEFFDTKKIVEYNSICEEVKKVEGMLSELDKIISEVEGEKKKLKKELQELEEESKNKDITMRRYEEISLKIKEKKDINNAVAHICAKKMKNAKKFDQYTLNYFSYDPLRGKKNLEEKLQSLLDKKERI